ncbi:Lipin/Ned1/Smp2-domain-containing protein [Cantharellus anzutake]|uniref:Lipin/Ned1/Smp2-domain-containing protein n=1 Tax=Cantharellus anzutake TaxID=1750568 RepID=UPI0019066FBD|nr:Lipin/Ned1/Smp2-domain-containing protein [Cantharellus anzutake]KAF8338980.1 Lipin/Ned1/Smp2-domain-containing protein [Cantharellus anzutake]
MPLAPMERAESSLRTVSHVDHDEGDAVEMSNTHEDAGPMRRASPEPEIFGAGGKLYPGSSTSSTAADIGLNTDKTTTFWVDIDSKQFVFELSLCGHLDRKDEVGDAQRFEDAKVSYKRFLEDESMVESENLVMRWNGVHISHRDASPLMNALSHWRNSASQAPVQSVPEFITTPPESPRQQPLVTISTPSSILPPIPEPEPLPLKAPVVHSRSLSWASWWRSKSDKDGVAKGAKIPAPKGGGRKTSSVALRDASPQRNDAPITAADPSLEAGQIPLKKVESSLPTSPPLPTQPPPPRKHYIKTLRLTSGQLKQLNLKKGVNTITFSLSSSGQIACTARIFVWDYQDPVVVSDIDGTITKSDALGHVFTMIGRDWTHVGVAKLYTDIAKNGYNIMYLTSRAIGQADSTRDYLKGIKQNDYHLPEGPVIMSPDRLMASLHREVIMKKPEVFKMACLRDIRGLYGSSIKTPFHAGFGNRITDALSYRSVNIPSSRIFTIDSNGEVKMELLELAGYKSSYIHMTDLVDQMFPPVHRKVASEFTDFNYWRLPIQVYEVPNLEPPSPALSARSDTSRLSRLAIGFGLRGKSSDQSLAEKSAKAAEKPPGTVPRVSSPLASPVLTANDPDEDLIGDGYSDRSRSVSPMIGERRDRRLSMPGSLHHEPADFHPEPGPEGDFEYGEPQEDEDPEDQAFNDELLATGEMDEIPYL